MLSQNEHLLTFDSVFFPATVNFLSFLSRKLGKENIFKLFSKHFTTNFKGKINTEMYINISYTYCGYIMRFMATEFLFCVIIFWFILYFVWTYYFFCIMVNVIKHIQCIFCNLWRLEKKNTKFALILSDRNHCLFKW